MTDHRRSSKITYAEFFELCNKSVENRTNLIVELRGLYPGMDYHLKTRLIEYLSSENEFVRAKRDLYRKSMEESSAAKSYVELMTNSPLDGNAYANALGTSMAKFTAAVTAAVQSADEFLKAYENMAKDETAIAREAQAAGLRFDPIFQQNAQGNRKRAEDTKQAAKGFATCLLSHARDCAQFL